jgi:hypothetical protein
MEKYRTLKSLAGIINFIAWLNLIAGIIIAIYSNSEKLGDIVIVTSVVSGLIGFVLLLGFGKLIQITLDIRENQIMTREETTATEASNESFTETREIEFSETTLLDLRKKILRQKQSIFGKKTDEILELLSRLITTKQKGLDIIVAYENQFGVSIIDELKSLSSNYGTIKENLKQFIEFEIVENEYPHKII